MNWNKFLALTLCCFMITLTGYGQLELAASKYVDFHELFFTGLKEKGIGNYQKALQSFEKAHQLDSIESGTLFELSKVHALLLSYDDAVYFAQLLLTKEPENKWVLDHLANVYTKQYRYADAINIREKIVAISPKQVDALILLYIKNKQEERALDLIKKAEDNAYATLRTASLKKYLLLRLLPKNNIVVNVDLPEKSLAGLRTAVKQDRSYKSYVNLLKYEEQFLLYKQLLKDASSGLELFPAQAQLYLSQGIALNKLEKFNLAVETLTIGVDFVIENPKMESEFYHQLSVSYGKLNQNKQAKKFAVKCLKLSKKE